MAATSLVAPTAASTIMKRDLYSEVSARIIAELEVGATPWIKPFFDNFRRKHALQCRDQSPLLRVQCHSALDGSSGRILHAAFSHV